MIYGMSWIFGLTGSIDYGAINAAADAAAAPNALALFIALVLMLAGFGYKIAAVPFHMWAPDVYTGRADPGHRVPLGRLEGGRLRAAHALLLPGAVAVPGPTARGRSSPASTGRSWCWSCRMVTMTLGNLAALRQQNVKRLLAYSSIAHAGYMLMGFVVLSDEGLRAHAVLPGHLLPDEPRRVPRRDDRGRTRPGARTSKAFAAWPGAAVRCRRWRWRSSCSRSPASRRSPASSASSTCSRRSFEQRASTCWRWSASLNSVVSLYYYARIVRTMFLDFPRGGEGAGRRSTRTTASCCGVLAVRRDRARPLLGAGHRAGGSLGAVLHGVSAGRHRCGGNIVQRAVL